MVPRKIRFVVSFVVEQLSIFSMLHSFRGQSHQIFHILVIIAALVHFHGINEMAMNRVSLGECDIKHAAVAL